MPVTSADLRPLFTFLSWISLWLHRGSFAVGLFSRRLERAAALRDLMCFVNCISETCDRQNERRSLDANICNAVLGVAGRCEWRKGFAASRKAFARDVCHIHPTTPHLNLYYQHHPAGRTRWPAFLGLHELQQTLGHFV